MREFCVTCIIVSATCMVSEQHVPLATKHARSEGNMYHSGTNMHVQGATCITPAPTCTFRGQHVSLRRQHARSGVNMYYSGGNMHAQGATSSTRTQTCTNFVHNSERQGM